MKSLGLAACPFRRVTSLLATIMFLMDSLPRCECFTMVGNEADRRYTGATTTMRFAAANFSPSQHCRRRDFFIQSAAMATTIWINQQAAIALGEGEQRMVLVNKPKAPLGALLPAVQQRLLLESCLVTIARMLDFDNSGDTSDSEIAQQRLRLRQQLESILLDPDKLPQINNRRNRDYAIMSQYAPNQVLTGDLTRATMNIYTANLVYNGDDSYIVTDPTWKKSYIRANNGLPRIEQVIQADLDLRDLIRNQVQLKVEDAAAEYYVTGDLIEVQALLQEAAQAMDQWLDRANDDSAGSVGQALKAAMEGRSVQVYKDSNYIADFVAPR